MAASGLAWSALRPTSFASNALHWAEAIRADEPIPNLTGTGAQGVVDPRDVAAVAVGALLTDEHDGAAHTSLGLNSRRSMTVTSDASRRTPRGSKWLPY